MTDRIDVREAEIIKIAGSREDVAALRQHLLEIIESKAFKGSHRSAQFLSYIMDQAIAGRFDSLKERVIGIELFGRSPTYDTGEDAIVRVTASDVRRRLLQHYGENGRSSTFNISLISGSYIPEILKQTQNEASSLEVSETHQVEITRNHLAVEDAPSAAGRHEISNSGESIPSSTKWAGHILMPIWGLGLSGGVLLLALSASLWGNLSLRTSRTETATISVIPWSALFNSPHATHVITSDPNIVHIQEITGSELSVSDYANRKYIPEPNSLSPEELRLCHMILWGDNLAAAVDTPIALKIAQLAQRASRTIDALAARSIQLRDLKSDDNFIFLGSPRSNPWAALFSDQLDFRFVFDKASGQEIITNVHPRTGELPAYIPTAQGWGTGQSFAIIAFVQNPDQNGYVLLLAGANGEGTEAAGKFATDLSRLPAALDRCGIHGGRLPQRFELLLGLKTMAGSPNDVDIVACHLLPGAKTN